MKKILIRIMVLGTILEGQVTKHSIVFEGSGFEAEAI